MDTGDDEQLEQIARFVTVARRGRGWSKERAAREANISSITWKRVEDGLAVQDAKLAAVEAALDFPTGTLQDVGLISVAQPGVIELNPRTMSERALKASHAAMEEFGQQRADDRLGVIIALLREAREIRPEERGPLFRSASMMLDQLARWTPEDWRATAGELFADWMIESGRSVEQLARETGVDEDVIEQLVRGERVPDALTARLDAALGLPSGVLWRAFAGNVQALGRLSQAVRDAAAAGAMAVPEAAIEEPPAPPGQSEESNP